MSKKSEIDLIDEIDEITRVKVWEMDIFPQRERERRGKHRNIITICVEGAIKKQ